MNSNEASIIADLLGKARQLSPNEVKKPCLDFADESFFKLIMQFDQNAIDNIKTKIPKESRRWQPDSKCWLVHKSEIETLLEIFKNNLYISHAVAQKYDVKFTPQEVAPEKPLPVQKFCTQEWRAKPQEETNSPYDIFLKKKLLPHQIWGVHYLVKNENAALLDEMGCGKSLQMISAINYLINNGKLQQSIIVCPLTLVPMWEKEVEESCHIKAVTLAKKTDIEKNKDAQIIVFHYEFLRSHTDLITKHLVQDKSMLIFDESQRIKNLQSQTTKAALLLRKFMDRCVILTGSPIANRPLDLFSQYLVLDEGETFGKKFNDFKNEFCVMDKFEVFKGRQRFFVERYVDVKNPEKLSAIMLRNSLRRTKDEVLDLPDLLSKTFHIALSSAQEKIYKEIKQGILHDISLGEDDKSPQKIENILARMIKLIQAATNPNLIFEDMEKSFPKLEALDELLENYLSDPTKKVILWSHFVKNVEFLQNRYAKDYNAVAHYGQMSLEEKQESIEKFRTCAKTKLIILTPQSAKEGLTLLPKNLENTFADLMIYFDHNFDAASFIQSKARFHRIGQKAQKCFVIHLIAKNTIEDYILKVLNDKLQTSIRIFNDERNEGNASPHLTFKLEDITKMLKETL